MSMRNPSPGEFGPEFDRLDQRYEALLLEGDKITSFGKPTAKHTDRLREISSEMMAIQTRQETLQRDSQMAYMRSGLANGSLVVEGPPGSPAGVEPVPAVQPWAGNRSVFGPSNPRAELRDRALAANERAEVVPDASRAHMDREIRNDPDPESRLARYVIATSDPDYLRAFSHWTADPVNGHREWDGPALAAFQRVQSESRAMALGTGGGGGFLVPYQLDPQILIAGVGSVNPMR